VQFWNDVRRLPRDVRECIDSWKKLEQLGFELLVFDECSAREFIRKSLGSRHERAFDKCYHPAMQSDYFRLCYILMEGGCYVDADDVYRGAEIEHLFSDGRLKIQPLCYDISTDAMVPPSVFTNSGANALNWIFYFNNNPLITVRSHPIIERALASATTSLERDPQSQLPEIQSTTGPGNLTKSIFEAVSHERCLEEAFLVVHDWEDIASTKWPLSYRGDERNWRLSNQREYRDRWGAEER
jgi:mannosyltransferase OCH1-like enzyme